MGCTSSGSKYLRKVLSKYNNRRCATNISHVNNNESNNLNTSNDGNVIGTSNFPHSNAQNGSSFDTIITLQRAIDIYSNVSINDENKYQNNASE